MSFDPDEYDDAAWAPQPIVLPTFRLPSRLAEPLSWGMLTAATGAVVAAVVTAVSYEVPLPPVERNAGSIVGTLDLLAPVRFVDRVALFARGGASLSVALLVLVAVVVSAMAVPSDGEAVGSPRRLPVLLVALSLMASIVLVGNVLLAVVTVSSTLSPFVASNSSDKFVAILNLLPQALTAAAALAYSVLRFRSLGGDVSEAAS